MTETNLEGHGVLWGSRNSILAWHEDMDEVFTIATRPEDVTSIVLVQKVRFYDASLDGKVKDMYHNSDICRRHWPIFGLTEFKDLLLAIEERGDHTLSLFDVINDDLPIYRIGSLSDTLDYRFSNFNLAADKEAVYISSSNVVRLVGNIPHKPLKLEKVTNTLSDYVYLASNGEMVFSVNSANSGERTVVRLMPDNKVVTYWDIKSEQSIGYVDMVALTKNRMVFGAHSNETKKRNFYVVEITPEMLKSKEGIKARPRLLLENAYEDEPIKPYSGGNPMALVPIHGLEWLIKRRRIPD